MSTLLQSENTSLPLVAGLAQLDYTDLGLAGGKGANLGELIRAGFDIPPGFVITTAAYDLFLQSNDLQGELQNTLTSLRTDEPASVKDISRHIRDTIQGALIPVPVTDTVLEAYRQLDGGAIAVRSSAIANALYRQRLQ